MKQKGRFGQFGGMYVPETLMPALEQLETAFFKFIRDPAFKKELNGMLARYVGRPTPLTFCPNLSRKYKTRIYLKREDLAHTGAHKINNALGQGLLAQYMNKKRVTAETGAGQHGVATATAGARLGIRTEIYMGSVDMERQRLNVFRMELLGAKVHPVESGGKTLKDAINEALRDWTATVEGTHYLLGSVLGPHPYPLIVRTFQSVIGREAKRQMKKAEGRLPDAIVACVGGGSNAMGVFYEFVREKNVRLIGVEAGGEGVRTGRHAARFGDRKLGRPGILHGTFTYVLQSDQGQIYNTHSVSAGLDYSAVGPEHAWLRSIGRAEYVNVTDGEALAAFKELAAEEGVIPALESAHAVAHALKLAKKMNPDEILLVNLSGRGDKDMEQAARLLEPKR